MEQTNMIPNGVPGQGGMQQRMQTPQSGNVLQQIHAKILTDLRNGLQQFAGGWQSTMDPRERAAPIMQLVTGLRLLEHDVIKCIGIAQNFEVRQITESQNKEDYMQRMGRKLAEITQRRSDQAQAMLPSAHMPMKNNSMAGNMSMQPNATNGPPQAIIDMNMQNGNMSIPMGQMGGESGQQNSTFPTQLQRPMQPTQIPPQPQNNTLDPSALQAPSMQTQMSNSSQPNQQQHSSQGGPAGPTHQEVYTVAHRMYTRMTEEKRMELRNTIMRNMKEEARQQAQATNYDPLQRCLLQKARDDIMKARAAQMGQVLPQNQGAMQIRNGQRMPNGNMQQLPTSQAGGGFDFSNILGQQAQAMRLQESGEQVVPASDNNNNNNNSNSNSNNNSRSGGGSGGGGGVVNYAGPMNAQQGSNPQILGNQEGQMSVQTPQVPDQMQFLMLQQERQQQERQKQERMAKQNMIAQQHALQQNQLRGQPGGLNAPNALNGGPAGQGNSPAMSMLNRPMVPPGQQPPSTPQQNRPGMPAQTPANGTNALLAHHANMLQQSNQGFNQSKQQPMNHARMAELFSQVPAQSRELLATMPPARVQEILSQIATSRMNPQAVGSNHPPGQQGMPPNANAQLGNQQGVLNGLPQNMGNVVPDFNSQPPPNQQRPIPPNIDRQLQMQNRLQQVQHQQQHQQQQQNQIRTQAMNSRPFPRQLLTELGNIGVPAQVQTWAQLKAHVGQHQSVMQPGTLARIQKAQADWFSTREGEIQLGLRELQLRQQQQPITGPQIPNAMPNGQAPPAQMVPPTAPMQPLNQAQGQNMNPQFGQQLLQAITPQEMQLYRQKFSRAQTMNDDQLRHTIQQHKARQVSVAQQQAIRQAQMQNSGTGVGGPQANMPQQVMQQAQQRPLMQPGQNPAQVNNQHQPGQKRQQGGNDDLVEIPNPNAPSMPAAQVPMQTQPPKGRQMPSKQELDGMTPEQRTQLLQRMQALRKVNVDLPQSQGATPGSGPAQQQQSQDGKGVPGQQITPQERQRLSSLYAEIYSQNRKGPAVSLDQEGLEQAKTILKKLWKPVQVIDSTLSVALRNKNFTDERLREIVRAKVITQHNVADAEGNFRDYLAVTPQQLRELEVVMSRYFGDMKRWTAQDGLAQSAAARANGGEATGGQAQQLRQPAGGAQRLQQAPPMGKSVSQQAHSRKQAAGSKAPPAPTEHKTFDWSAPSPHGVPKYDGSLRNDLTPDKLRFPPPKKRKPNQPDSQASTPAGQQTGTPGATTGAAAGSSPGLVGGVKALSSEQQRQAAALAKQESEQREAELKWNWKCKDLLCEGSVEGFETEEELRGHVEGLHRAVEDPLEFLLGSAEKALVGPGMGKVESGRVGVWAEPGIEREGVTPRAGVTPAATPDSRDKGKAASASRRLPADSKSATVNVAGTEKVKTLRESLAEKMGFLPTLTSTTTTQCLEPPASNGQDSPAKDTPSNLWADIANTVSSGLQDFSLTPSELTHIDDWGLRPEPEHPSSSPETTPSAASQSSQSSDVSQSDRLRINLEWDAFGYGDEGLMPDMLQLHSLGLAGTSELPQAAEGEVLEGFDGQVEDGKMDEAWQWGGDLMEWDVMFGPNEGLDNNSFTWDGRAVTSAGV